MIAFFRGLDRFATSPVVPAGAQVTCTACRGHRELQRSWRPSLCVGWFPDHGRLRHARPPQCCSKHTTRSQPGSHSRTHSRTHCGEGVITGRYLFLKALLTIALRSSLSPIWEGPLNVNMSMVRRVGWVWHRRLPTQSHKKIQHENRSG